ncbi:hypothetical protein [Sorangium sp. So ce394]|uniref:hypothetical protein n=1 Tax=Sorangium sp. So ce394 TaxID=3133310 RepID=UPI003F5BD196
MSRPHDGRARRARPAHGASRPRRHVRRAALAGATALGAAYLLSIEAAHAEPEPRPRAARLEYVRGRGAERCPDASFLRAEVARVVGADPFRDDAPLLISATIERQGTELVASLALRDSEGKTRWADGFSTSRACEVLVAGVGLAVAAQLLSMPERGSREASPRGGAQAPGAPGPMPPAQAPQGAPGPMPSAQGAQAPQAPSGHAQAPEGPPRASPPPQTARTAPAPSGRAAPALPTSSDKGAPAGASEPLRIEAGLGATVGLGITPGVAAGTTLAIGARWSDWSVAVEGRGLVSLAKEVEGVPLGTTAFTAATVACLRGRHLFGCGLATLGAVRFAPEEPWDLRVRSKALFGIGARLGSAWRLSDRWSAHVHAEAIGIVEEARLRRQVDHGVTPAPLYWTSPPLGAAFGLGVTASY